MMRGPGSHGMWRFFSMNVPGDGNKITIVHQAAWADDEKKISS
jgi:hypothetical protein